LNEITEIINKNWIITGRITKKIVYIICPNASEPRCTSEFKTPVSVLFTKSILDFIKLEKEEKIIFASIFTIKYAEKILLVHVRALRAIHAVEKLIASNSIKLLLSTIFVIRMLFEESTINFIKYGKKIVRAETKTVMKRRIKAWIYILSYLSLTKYK